MYQVRKLGGVWCVLRNGALTAYRYNSHAEAMQSVHAVMAREWQEMEWEIRRYRALAMVRHTGMVTAIPPRKRGRINRWWNGL